jgi:hypothetical protein
MESDVSQPLEYQEGNLLQRRAKPFEIGVEGGERVDYLSVCPLA